MDLPFKYFTLYSYKKVRNGNFLTKCIHEILSELIWSITVRLVGGSNPSEGRVEVMHKKGSWGGICGYYWGLADARVVCKMLGYDLALEAPTSARFGRGSGDSVLRKIECKGDETDLSYCSHECYPSRHCWPRGDGVVCGHKSEYYLRIALFSG